ncbi:MAG: acyltransferase [bacterium]
MTESPELLVELQALHRSLRDAKRAEFDRVLPFGDLLVDRWEKARYLGFGQGASIYDASLVFGEVHVGEGTWVGPFTILDGTGGLSIGEFCSISAGVHVYTHDSVEWALSGGRAEYARAPVVIGNCCYVGPNSVITRGVRIGHHCLVGANSIVNKDLPDNAIAFGATCKIVGRVEIDPVGRVTLVYY